MIPMYENEDSFCHIKYWEIYKFASVRRPHLGLIVAELKSPSDCYNHSNTVYLDKKKTVAMLL